MAGARPSRRADLSEQDRSAMIAEAMAGATQTAREAMFPNQFQAVCVDSQFAFLLRHLTTCADVEAAIAAIVEFCSAFWSPLGRVWVETRGERVYVRSVTLSDDRDKVFLHDMRSCAVTLSALDWLAGGALRDLRAQSAGRAPLRAEWLDYVFPYRFTPGEPFTAYSLRVEDLKHPIVRSAAEVDAFISRLSVVALEGNAARMADDARVRSIIEHEARENGRIATLDLVCRRLNISAATIRRRLSAEAISYRALRDAVLNGLACEYLMEPASTVADVSNRIGYSEEAAFRRSFKRLNGCSPAVFRSRAGTSRDKAAVMPAK